MTEATHSEAALANDAHPENAVATLFSGRASFAGVVMSAYMVRYDRKTY